jgi:hypothetical protein
MSLSSHEEETDAILGEFCASARISRRPLWAFCTLDSMDPSVISHYLFSLKEYWRPNGGTLEIPEEWSVRIQNLYAAVHPSSC